MPHVISQKCITEVYAACQQVCPADTMHLVNQMPAGYPAPGQPMMVINPDECIDCGACKPECPIDAIIAADQQETPQGLYWRATMTNLAPAFVGQKSAPRGKNEPPRRGDNQLR